jgi:hypothetical protein
MKRGRTSSMGIIAYLMSMATTFFIVALIMVGVIKTFQVATDVREIKEAIQELRRNAQVSPRPLPEPATAMHQNPPSPEELVRAVNAQSFSDKSPV